MISILCTSRSGSTSLTTFIAKCINKSAIHSPFLSNKDYSIDILNQDNLYKLMIHNLPKEFDNMLDYGYEIIKKSETVILLDRLNKREQAESLVFKKMKYGDSFEYYQLKEYYNKEYLDESNIDTAISYYKDHSMVLKELSEKFDIPIWYYENIFYDKEKLKELCEYCGVSYDENYYKKYMHPNLKNRLEKNTKVII